jgi:hypothetical protein
MRVQITEDLGSAPVADNKCSAKEESVVNSCEFSQNESRRNATFKNI